MFLPTHQDAVLESDGAAEDERGRARSIGRLFLLLAIGAIGLSVSCLGGLALHQTIREGEQVRQAEVVTEMVSAVNRQVEPAIRLAEATAAFLAALPEVAPADFERFAAGWPVLMDTEDAVRALAFLRRIETAELPAFLARIEAERVMGQRPDYPDLTLFPESEGPIRLPAWMVEPPQARATLYGFDLSADEGYRPFLAAAATTGLTQMGQPARLEEPGAVGELRTLILAAVRSVGSPRPEGLEDPTLAGFVGVEFLPGRALAAALTEVQGTAADVGLAVEDWGPVGAAAPVTMLFATDPTLTDAEFGGTRMLTEMIVAGRIWRVTVDPGAGSLARTTALLPYGVFGVGVLLTAALVLLVARVHNSRARMEQRVRESTRSLRKIAMDLARSRDQAFRASAAKSEFLARMSHELRSPLTAILGFSEIIRDRLMGPLGTPIYGEYARDIHDSGSHLLSIVSDLLDLSKIDAGRQTLEEGLIDPSAVMSELVRLNASTAATAEIKLTHRSDDGEAERRLWADGRLVRQMLQNLVSNALKFTPPGGTVTLYGESRLDGTQVLAVTDTGIGMTPQQVALARQPFTQIENVFQRTRDGAGLGLALVDGMVRLHGGRFEILSTPGQGTTGLLIFPAERDRRVQDEPEPEAEALPESEPVPGSESEPVNTNIAS